MPLDNADFFRSVGGVAMMRGITAPAWYFGWVPHQPTVESYLHNISREMFAAVGAPLAGSGAGRTVLLYEAARQVWGRDLDVGPQLIGDCVSWGFAGCVDLVACLEVVAGEAEEYPWERRATTEAIYALSRVEFGNFDGSDQDGSYGSWAAKAVKEGGTLSRMLLGPYDPARAKQWGASGLPDQYEPEAKQHRIRRTAAVRSFEEARDAIANGYPVAVCSDQGFELVRDEQGFAAPNDTWYHCMKFVAARDDRRPGLLCMNSWGANSPTGPKGEHDIPDGSFWVDARTCTRMLQQGDSFAVSQFDGYPRRASVLAAFSR